MTAVEHRALQSVAVQFFVNGAVVASYIPRLPEIRDDLGVSLGAIGVILAVASGTGVAGSAVQGPVIAALGTRRAMIVSSVVLVTGMALVGVSSTVWMLIAALAVVSISDVITDVSMNMQGSALSAKRSVPVVNRLHGLWSVGTVVGGVIASVTAALAVPLALHLAGAAAVLGLVLIYVSAGLLRTDEGLLSEAPATESGGKSQRARTVVGTFVALGAAAIIPEFITSDWAAFRLADDLDASNGIAGLGFVAFTTGMVIGRFSADVVVARRGAHSVLQIATGITAVGTLAAMIVPNVAVSLAGLVVTGLGVSVMFPQLYDAAVRSRHSASALGALTAGSRIALLGAPLIVGTLAGAGTMLVGVAIAVVTVPAALIVLGLSRRLAGTSADQPG